MKIKSALLLKLLIPAVCLALTLPAFADTGTWSATSGTWNTSATNWTGVSGTPWDSSNGTTNTGNFTSTSGSATVSGTVYANQITYTAASGQFAINNGTINLAGATPTISVNSSRILTIGSSLAGSAGLIKSAAGTLTLSGNNSYSGATTISGGVLRISNNNALGAGGAGNATTISTSGTLELQGNITVASEGLDHNGGTSGFIRNLSGSNTWNGNITIGAVNSRIQSDTNSLLTIGGDMTLTASLIFQGNGNTTVTGTIGGSSALSLGNNMADSGVVTLSGNNSYSGLTLVNKGTLSVNSLKDVGLNSSVGTGTGTGADIIYLGGSLASGTLQYTGAGDTHNRRIRIGGLSGAPTDAFGAVIRNDGSGALVFSNATFNSTVSASANRTLTLGGTNTANNTISGVIANNTAGTGLVAVTKADAGTWVLSGGNTYTGNTTVAGGTLRSTRSLALTNSAAIVVSNAGSTLAVNYGASSNYSQAEVGTLLAKTTFASSATALGFDTTDANGTYAVNLTVAAGLTKLGGNTLTLTGTNTYSGATAVAAGTLNLNTTTGSAAGSSTSVSVATNAILLVSQSDQVNNGAAVTLSGGTIRRAGGVNEVFGSLTLAAGSFLDYGTGAAGTLEFGAYTPTLLLTVQNFSVGNTLKFGNNIGSSLPTGGALTNSFFSFNNAFTYDPGTFTITAIPEPSTVIAALSLLGLMSWPAVRRLRARRANAA